MYIDFKKMAKKAGVIVGGIVIGYGVISFLFLPTTGQQSLAVQLAIFGLLIVWFSLWVSKKDHK